MVWPPAGALTAAAAPAHPRLPRPRSLSAPAEFESPQAPDTTVLVTGATGRVGRILVRKLLLRGYKVRALVRQRDGAAADAIPQSVELVVGDVGDYRSCRAAMNGVDKVICASAARTTITADLLRVEEQGVANLTRAFMVRPLRGGAPQRNAKMLTPSLVCGAPPLSQYT